jgi:hypothetical protein
MKAPRQNKYPKKIHLKSATYRIKFVANLESIGETDALRREIRIRKNMSDNETLRTFIHEVLHFMEFEFPVKLKHKTVYKLEKAIFAFLMDNF